MTLLITEGDFSRHCKKSSLDSEGKPTAASFSLRPDEAYVSVNLLRVDVTKTDFELIQETYNYMVKKGYKFKKKEVFAKVNIPNILGKTKDSLVLEIKDCELPHCGLFFEKSKELLIGTILAQNISSSYIC